MYFEHLFHRQKPKKKPKKKTKKKKKKKKKKKGGGRGGCWSRISENEKNSNHDSQKLKFAIFESFTTNGESIRDINEG